MDGRNLDDMRKAELMMYAKDVLGIETRKIGAGGKNNLWRSVAEVRRECKEKEARLCQSPHAPGLAESSLAVFFTRRPGPAPVEPPAAR